MSEPERSSSEEELEKTLADADALAQAGDWDKAIAGYRKLLSFDRVYQGAEAKLQWALRMRDTETLYQKGQAALAQSQFAVARTSLNKARLLYASSYKDTDKLIVETWYAEGKQAMDTGNLTDALTAFRKVRDLSKSHYKDTDDLIVQAETLMQKQKWNTRPGETKTKGCFLFGASALFVLIFAFVLASCAPVTPGAPATTPGGSASKVAPAQRNEMYKSPPAMAIDVSRSYQATVKTTKGDIVLSLDAKNAPQTVNNFVFLARAGFYDNLTFHRYVPDFVIQGGDPLGTGTGGPGYTVPGEFKLKHGLGAIAMARLSDQANPKRDSSGSQFYIALAPLPQLDAQYTVFGQAQAASMPIVSQLRQGDGILTVLIEEK